MEDYLFKVIVLVVALVGTLVASFVVTRLVRKVLEKADVPSASLFVNLVRGLIYALGILFVLKPVFGIEPTGFIAALGVASVALSLGLQDTISNLIGGLSLLLTKSLQPGDDVTISGVSGTVTDVGWRATTVQDLVGNQQIIPNSVLNTTALFKYKPTNYQQVALTLVIRPDADLIATEREILELGEAALGDRLGHAFPSVLRYRGMTDGGIQATAVFSVAEGESTLVCTDDVMRCFSQRPWLGGWTGVLSEQSAQE